ncbi:hypothetical protein GCM10010269_13890 [Streptomyces humidus]|uniref:Uncharacterized protein n=1 Tax=Streptomyces humidus TaxID=52259 RepID=A0A918FS99_9ACTN|nr:hypothetical protein GCM10010269_13890 [Streptomyces humidus]
MPGWAFSNVSPRVVKLSFREAAANTVTVPDSWSAEDADAEVGDSAAEESPDDEQALRTSSAAAPAPAA